ncbi:hypothetical protein FPV67DRAFT_1463491 [Lyophyllum atratum]|nr:hypothetical protein FPV67DRAFT_1463491 [Lyophyllum atratum]
MAPRIPKRCHFFNSDGSKRRGGCRKGSLCLFTHPSDSGWTDAVDSNPPFFAGRRSPPPYDRKPPFPRDRSPPRRHRSPSPPRSYNRSAERSSRPSGDYYTHEDTRIHSRSSSQVSDLSNRQRRIPPPTSGSTLPPPSTATLSPPPSSSTSLPPPILPSTFMPPPPSTPLSTFPPPIEQIQPPLPLIPTPPAFLSRKPSATPQLTPDELRTIWAERIRILAECVGNRQQFGKVENDISNARQLMLTLRFPGLPDDGKQRLQDELTKLEADRERLKKKRDEGITQLIKLNSWPAAPISEAEEGELARHEEMLKYVTGLEETATEMNALLIELRERKALELGGDATTSMDVDPQQDSSGRPLKRRRLSDSGRPEYSPGPTNADIEAMQEKFADLEARYSDFQNDMIAHDSDMLDGFKAEMDMKLLEFSQSLPAAPTEPPGVYNDVRENIDTTGNQVAELAEGVSHLVLQSDAQYKEIEAVKHRIEAANTVVAQMQQQFQSYTDSREQDRKTVNALEATLQAYMNHPPSNAVPSLTHDQLVVRMQEPLVDIVRATVRPLIETLRDQVQKMLNCQNQEMYKTLWSKLSLTLRMVETISQRIERAEQTGAKVRAVAS